VQGVFYRDSMRQEANRLGVTGWVRNRPDGTVEAMVQGGADSVDAIVAWANRGPLHARVTRVDVGIGNGSYQRFDVIV
jgi:acylphosphatase